MTRHERWWGLFQVACCGLVLGCYEASDGPQAGGHTNWLTCEQLSHCSRDTRAVACSAGYCLDADGERIAIDDGDRDGGASSTVDTFDTASCDPSVFEQTLDPTPDNIARALDPHCFNTGAGRRALVIDALCARDMACAVDHAKGCSAEYEASWQEGLLSGGRSVPCMDAVLDSMSCLAQASCNDAHACDAASEHAEVACDPNAPTLGAPTCPLLPEDRELTKGPIPPDAINDAGMLDETRAPDFIPALDQRGQIAGYVRLCAISAGGAVPVYGDDLETVVGHMVPGRGFVPGALP